MKWFAGLLFLLAAAFAWFMPFSGPETVSATQSAETASVARD